VKKNLTWLGTLLLLTVFTLPPTLLADNPDPNCTASPQSCQPPIPLSPVPHPRGK
jgi:hypothetical protein